jgi:hypothetical protein
MPIFLVRTQIPLAENVDVFALIKLRALVIRRHKQLHISFILCKELVLTFSTSFPNEYSTLVSKSYCYVFQVLKLCALFR